MSDTSTDTFVPEQGDLITLEEWPSGMFLEVWIAGTQKLFGLRSDGYEMDAPLNRPWVQFVDRPSLPDAPARWAHATGDEVAGFVWSDPLFGSARDAVVDAGGLDAVVAVARYTPAGVRWPDEVSS